MNDPGNEFRYRLDRLESDYKTLGALPGDYAVMRVQLENLTERLSELSDGVKFLRRSLWTLAFSITGSAVALVFSAFQLFGH